jgi:hypothetical protein
VSTDIEQLRMTGGNTSLVWPGSHSKNLKELAVFVKESTMNWWFYGELFFVFFPKT